MTVPGVGFVGALGFWGPLEVVSFAVVVGAGVVLWRSGDRGLRAIVALTAGFASLMNRVVWAEWWGFGRVLLPLVALAVAAGAFGWTDTVSTGEEGAAAGSDRRSGAGRALVARVALLPVPR